MRLAPLFRFRLKVKHKGLSETAEVQRPLTISRDRTIRTLSVWTDTLVGSYLKKNLV